MIKSRLKLLNTFIIIFGISSNLFGQDNNDDRGFIFQKDSFILVYSGEADSLEWWQIKQFDDSVNLKNPDLREFYKTAKVDIVGKEPGTTITKIGQPMVYGITILDNAPNKELALKFIDFILSKEGGSRIMEENGQPSMVPSPTNTFDNIPEELKRFATK